MGEYIRIGDKIMTNSTIIAEFKAHLDSEEKSAVTVSKYVRDAQGFLEFVGSEPITKEICISYKNHLVGLNRYTVGSINTILASVNSFVKFIGKPECTVNYLKAQKELFSPVEKELTRAEYIRLLGAAKTAQRLSLILQTICSTGIRVSELQYFTVEALKKGEVTVRCKNKSRNIMIPRELTKKLIAYVRGQKIKSGIIFRTRSGRPIDRSNIWTAMKRLCLSAGVMPTKVFPHNLRKLFARSFYNIEKDIARLADILGHSSINTTRIYIMTSGAEHRRQIESLRLIPSWT